MKLHLTDTESPRLRDGVDTRANCGELVKLARAASMWDTQAIGVRPEWPPNVCKACARISDQFPKSYVYGVIAGVEYERLIRKHEECA